MATRRNGSSPASATQVIVRVILYYIALLAIGGALYNLVAGIVGGIEIEVE